MLKIKLSGYEIYIDVPLKVDDVEFICKFLNVDDLTEVSKYQYEVSKGYIDIITSDTLEYWANSENWNLEELDSVATNLNYWKQYKITLLLAIIEQFEVRDTNILETVEAIENNKCNYYLYEGLGNIEFSQRMYNEGLILTDLPSKYENLIDWVEVWDNYFEYSDNYYSTSYGILVYN